MRIVGLCLVPVILICLVGAPPVWAQNGCAFFTQGYWKNHPDAWPLDTLTLGAVTYSKDQLLLILRRPVRGNGLVALAHQLIAAKLNVALNEQTGFTIPDSVQDLIRSADNLIGQLTVPPVGTGWLHPSVTSELVMALDEFNEGAYPCEEGGVPGGGC
jgi:hypothetical protein